ncbi:MAG: hypothetical protein JWN30_2012 [Bacilli bacterium]|nr:hypothetical protein [Bacilli bacterium]
MPEWLNIVVRSIVSLAYLFILTKLIGKRQLSQMTVFDYIAGITVGDIAAFTATNMDGPMLHGFIALTIFALFPVAMGLLAVKSKKVRDIVDGKGTVLIKHGKILEDNLKKERMSTDELLEQLRLKNAFQVSNVEFAVMEPNGAVSVLLKSQNEPLTPKHMGFTVSPTTEPQTVIMDGNIMQESLATIGLNNGWLLAELEKLGVSLDNVFLGQVDSNAELYVDLYDDVIKVPEPQTLKLTYFTLKKCQADIELFALSTKDQAAKMLFSTSAERLQRVIDRVTPLMTR